MHELIANREVRQIDLDCGINHAPFKVRQHGLSDAHQWPLVSHGKIEDRHGGSYRVPASKAWRFPEIELRTGNSYPSIVLDLDGANALYRLVDAVAHGDILMPNWAVTRKASGGTHAVWNLARPVHRGDSARQAPLRAFARVSEFYAATLTALACKIAPICLIPLTGPRFCTK